MPARGPVWTVLNGRQVSTDLKVRRWPPEAAALPFPYIVLVGGAEGD